ncbi:hypothetical protein [Oryza sativa Japonica Group]|uniref:Uncharacterized protein n=2 Tax=Oryza sativa subsp. japonica TaxID=39947 RepID=Q657V1_ORYSJ|nr:hypothetical protein [Oryza sativa Japonica Group]BAD44926.1 hypothetical protein [Oryza sativa Japonica Group]
MRKTCSIKQWRKRRSPAAAGREEEGDRKCYGISTISVNVVSDPKTRGLRLQARKREDSGCRLRVRSRRALAAAGRRPPTRAGRRAPATAAGCLPAPAAAVAAWPAAGPRRVPAAAAAAGRLPTPAAAACPLLPLAARPRRGRRGSGGEEEEGGDERGGEEDEIGSKGRRDQGDLSDLI